MIPFWFIFFDPSAAGRPTWAVFPCTVSPYILCASPARDPFYCSTSPGSIWNPLKTTTMIVSSDLVIANQFLEASCLATNIIIIGDSVSKSIVWLLLASVDMCMGEENSNTMSSQIFLNYSHYTCSALSKYYLYSASRPVAVTTHVTMFRL